MKKYLFHAAVLFFLVTLTQICCLPAAHGVPGDFLFQWGSQQHFSAARALAVDGNGNVYVTDTSCVQVFNSAGTRIRKWGSYGSGDGQFKYPAGIAVDGSGNVYVVDSENFRVQVFDNAGNFIGKWGSEGTGNGLFMSPAGIAVDKIGNVYVTDMETISVQVFDSEGNFLRQLGSAGTGNGQFHHPTGIAVDGNGNVYVADMNFYFQIFTSSGSFIRAVAVEGFCTDVAVDNSGNMFAVVDGGGGGSQLFVYDTAGNKIRQLQYVDQHMGLERYWQPCAVAVSRGGNAYTLDFWTRYGLIAFDAAGNILSQWWMYGTGDEQLSHPTGIAVDLSGNVYETDGLNAFFVNNDRVRGFDSTGKVLRKWLVNSDTSGIAVDEGGNVYVLQIISYDNYQSSVQVLDSSGNLLRKWGDYGTNVGQFADPLGIAVDHNGNVLVADTGNSRIQVFGNAGNFLRQFGSLGTGNGQFSNPEGIAIDGSGNIFVSDTGNSRVQVFDSAGNYLRQWGKKGFTNGYFSRPSGIAIDGNGNVFVADAGNNRIQIFTSAGVFLRKLGSVGDDNGFFREPRGVAVDKTGTKVYVADTGNNRIQAFAGYGNQLLPTPWATSDIGTVVLAGSAGYQNGTFTLNGSGVDIWGTADGFRYVYQTLTGDGQIVARVATVQNTNAWAKVGVMIRESLAANSRNAMMALTPGNVATFLRRLTNGGSSVSTNRSSAIAPYWVRLVRSGNTFSGYVSSDSVNWVLVGSDTIAMASTVYVGLAVTSHNNTALCTATLDGVSVRAGAPVTPPTVNITAPDDGASFTAPAAIAITATASAGTGATVSRVDFYAGTTLVGSATTSPYSFAWSSVPAGSYSLTARITDSLNRTATSSPVGITVAAGALPTPWTTRDIGSVGIGGSASYLNGTFSLNGSGTDIWGTADSFRYVYHSLAGDGQIVARVASLQNINSWAKGGVMIRETLAANSRQAMMVLTPGNGAAFQRRLVSGGLSVSTAGPRVTAPYWVRLVRSGNTFSGYVSSNGTNWVLVGSDTITMASSVYVGLAVTSHNNAALCTATLDGVQ